MLKMNKYAFADALLAAAYIVVVALFMGNGQAIFGSGKNLLVPISLLLLFVLSAAVTGALILGRSVLWYLDGHKKDAVILFAYKLVILLVVFVLALFLVYILH